MLLVCGLGAAAPAQGQVRYACRDDAGNNFTLSRPCPAGTRTVVAVGGPAPSATYSPSYPSGSIAIVHPPPDEPEHFKYLSERCRSLYRAQRTGHSTPMDVQEGMRREYRRDCEEAESQASTRLYKERREAKAQAQEREKQSQAAERVAQEQASLKSAQCNESRRIIEAKKKRADLTDGERADLRRFEDNVLARCGG